MKADGVALAFEHGAFQIIVQQHPRQPAPGLEGRLMAAQKAGHAGIGKEAQQNLPRPTQHHHERHQRALRPADGDLTEMTPIDLRLLPRQGLQPQIGFGLRPWSVVQ